MPVWEYSGPLPLAVLALSKLDKGLKWLVDVAMIHCFYGSQDRTQESEWVHRRQMPPLVELAWKTTLGASPPHIHDRTVRGMGRVPASVSGKV